MADYSKLSDDDLINLYNNDYSKISNEGLKTLYEDNTPVLEDIQLNEDGTRKEVLKGSVKKNVNLTPSGISKGIADNLIAGVQAPYYAIKNKQNLVDAFNFAKDLNAEKLQQAYEKYPGLKKGDDISSGIQNFAAYAALPAVKGGLGAQTLNAAAQGGLIAGLESTKNNGLGTQNLSDAAIGAGVGATLPPLLRGTGIVAGKIANNPTVQNITGKTIEALTSVPKNLYDRALKAELAGKSILGGKFDPETAYQPVEKSLRKALKTLPSKEDYAEMYSKLAKKAKEGIDKKLLEKNVELNGIIKEMPESASDISALRESIDEGLDKFRFGDVNPALEEAGGVINHAKSQLGYKSADEINEALQNYSQKYKNSIGMGTLDKEAEDIAFNILAQATGKNKNWLKSQLKAVAPKIPTEKRQDYINRLLEQTADKVENIDPTWQQYFPDVNWNNLQESIDGGYNVAYDMFDRIMGRNFRKAAAIAPEEAIAMELDEGYAKLLDNLIKNPNEKGYNQAIVELENLLSSYGEKYLDDAGRNLYFERLLNDFDNIDNIINPKVKPATLHGVKEQLYDRANFGGDNFGNYGNSGIKSVAQDINQYLRNQNPAYAGINDELKLLNSVKYDLGGPQGINQNTLAAKLRGIGSEANTLTNMDDRLKSLNTLLDNEYKFYNDAARIAQAQRAQVELESLIGGRQFQRNPRLLGNINDIARQQALEDLQARTNVNFMDELQNIQAREALERLFPGQGGGSGSAQGFGNLLRTSIIGGAPTAAAITRNPFALAGLGLISPKLTGQGAIRAFGALNIWGNTEINPGLYNLILQTVERGVGGEK